MKVDELPGWNPWAGVGRTDPNGRASSGGFTGIFRQALEASRPDAAAAAPPAAAAGASGEGTLEGFLDLLDEFRRRLGDGALPLRGLDPIVRRLEAGCGALERAAEALPEGDALRDLCRRAQIAATVEIVKFNRGDYLVGGR